MKKALALILVVVTLSVMLASCGGNDIIGTWTATEEGVTMELTFNKDGTGSVATMGATVEMTWTLEGDTLNASMSIMGVSTDLFKDATISVDGDELSITYLGETTVLTRK